MLLALLAAATLTANAGTKPSDAPSFNLGPHILGLSRVLTFVWTEQTPSATPNSGTSASGGGVMSFGGSVIDTPRIGYDGLLNRWLTLGLDFAIGVSNTRTGYGALSSPYYAESSTFTIGVAPRVGALLPLSSTVAVWPRLGFAFLYSRNQSNQNAGVVYYESIANTVTAPQDDQLYVPIDAEVLVVVSPFSHFGITVGASFDPLLRWGGLESWHFALFGGVVTYW